MRRTSVTAAVTQPPSSPGNSSVTSCHHLVTPACPSGAVNLPLSYSACQPGSMQPRFTSDLLFLLIHATEGVGVWCVGGLVARRKDSCVRTCLSPSITGY